MAQRVCPNCGKIENEFTYFCTECGSKTELKEGAGPSEAFSGNAPMAIPKPAIKEEPVQTYPSTSSTSAHVTVTESGVDEGLNNNQYVSDVKPSREPDASVRASNTRDNTKQIGNKYIKIAVVAFATVLLIGIVAAVVVNINKGRKRGTHEEANNSSEIAEQAHETSEDTVEKAVEEVADDDNDAVFDSSEDEYEDFDPEDSQIEDDVLNVDTESEVGLIREKYNDIMSDISDGSLDINSLGSGITAYSKNGDIKAVFVNKGIDNNEYSRKYYYDNGHLIFAYIEGNDANRLYFSNDRLFRWRYSPNALNPQDAVNHDGDYADGYVELENYALDEGYRYIGTDIESKPKSDYILPDSDKVYLSKSDLRGLSKDECRLARNELYARHGRRFDDEELMRYFMQFDWYNPRIAPEDFEESMLNDYEMENRDLIVEYEKEMGYR